MTTSEHITDDIRALLQPLPELEAEIFTRSVMARTKRIQQRRKILDSLIYLSAVAFSLFVLPWQTLIAALNNIGNIISLSAGAAPQINVLSGQLQTILSFQDIQIQQMVILAAAASVLVGTISYLMTES